MKDYAKILITESFYALSGALFVFSIMESIKKGSVLAYLNINSVLLAWLIIAIMVLVFTVKDNEK